MFNSVHPVKSGMTKLNHPDKCGEARNIVEEVWVEIRPMSQFVL
jgi:hypothetical protein